MSFFENIQIGTEQAYRNVKYLNEWDPSPSNVACLFFLSWFNRTWSFNRILWKLKRLLFYFSVNRFDRRMNKFWPNKFYTFIVSLKYVAILKCIPGTIWVSILNIPVACEKCSLWEIELILAHSSSTIAFGTNIRNKNTDNQ